MNANGGPGSSEQGIRRAWRGKNRQNGQYKKNLIHLENCLRAEPANTIRLHV
jgi:hypothetical protein